MDVEELQRDAPRGGHRADRQAGRAPGWRSTSSRCSRRRSCRPGPRTSSASRSTPEEMLAKTGRTQDRKTAGEIVELIESRAREAYARREVEYPVDHLLSFVYGDGQTTVENPYAADYVRSWATRKYGVAAGTDLTPERIRELGVRRLRDELIGLQEKFLHDGQLDRDVDAIVQGDPKPQEVADRFRERFGVPLDPAELHGGVVKHSACQARTAIGNGRADATATATTVRGRRPAARGARPARQILRQELTDLEQFVLIQIFDQSWKDHLFAMDMLKSGIGLQAFAERDPRVLYKKEGYRVLPGDDGRHPRQGHRPDLPRPHRRPGRGPQRLQGDRRRPRGGRTATAWRRTSPQRQGVDKGATVAGDEAGPEDQAAAAGASRPRSRSRRSSTRPRGSAATTPAPAAAARSTRSAAASTRPDRLRRKSEARSTKPETSSETGNKKRRNGGPHDLRCRRFEISTSGFRYCFGFRASDFRLAAHRYLPPSTPPRPYPAPSPIRPRCASPHSPSRS